MQGLVDTHCHLQAPAFEADLVEVVARARAAGVADMVVCAGGSDDWERTACVAREHGLAYMLGIHPLLVPKEHEEDLERLSALAEASMADPHFIGIGEIGLEGLVMTIDARQEHFFREQLRIAARLDLPCSGLKLGFGGAATYEGSLRIRRHLAEVPADAFVLESDAPDMPSSARRDSGDLRSEPADVAQTASLAARLRGVTRDELLFQSIQTTQAAFKRLKLR